MATLLSAPSSPPPISPSPNPKADHIHLPTAAAYTRLLRRAATSSPPDNPLAVAAFTSLLAAGHLPDAAARAFPFAFRAAAHLGHLPLGLQLHSLLAKSGLLSNPFCACALLDLYAKLCPLGDARKLFDRMPRTSPVAWNSMILRYAQEGFLDASFELMAAMDESGLPVGASTWNAIIAGCGRAKDAELAVAMLGDMVSIGDVVPNVATFNTLLYAIAVLRSLDVLRELHAFVLRNSELIGLGPVDFDRLREAFTAGYRCNGCIDYASHMFHDVRVSTGQLGNLMISSLLNSGRTCEAFDIFREMAIGYDYGGQHLSKISLTLVLPEVGQESKRGLEIHAYAYRHGLECDTSVCNALMAMYAKRDNIDRSEKIFRGLADKDIVSWNTMISSYAMIHDFDRSFELFQEMQGTDIRPDEYTFTSILDGCSFASYLRQAMALHGQMMKMGLCYSYVADLNALMDAYGKCGSIEDAHKVFDEISWKDTISWNIIILCYGYSASPRHAISLFHRMQEEGFKPNRVTFIAVLSACSHVGLLDEALRYFQAMETHYGIIPDEYHYACIVDCFGRAGLLKRAYEFIQEMPIVPNDGIWGALLSSCRVHGNIELAEIAAKNLIKLDPNHSGYWVLLSNIYAKASRWNDMAQLRAAMKQKGVKKCPGYSWIEVGDSELHRFLTADELHKQCDDIYEVLGGLTEQLRDEGYRPRIDATLTYADVEIEKTDMIHD